MQRRGDPSESFGAPRRRVWRAAWRTAHAPTANDVPHAAAASSRGGIIDIDNHGSGDTRARFMSTCPMRAFIAPDDYDPSEWDAMIQI